MLHEHNLAVQIAAAAQSCGFSQDAIRTLLRDTQKLEQLSDASDCMNACKSLLFDGGDPWPRLEQLSDREDLHLFTTHLLFLLFCVDETESRYRQAGIPHEIYLDSVKDIRCKAEETFDIYGIWGLHCGPWVSGLITLHIFCLGRLQFEPMKSDFFCRIGQYTLDKGDPVLNVHVPSFGRLNYPAVQDAYRRAAEFFRSDFPGGCIWLRCETWLFYPQLTAMFPEGNMKRFAADYTLVHACIDPMQDDRYRVFGLPPTVPVSQYPQNNLLQKRLKQWLEEGNRMGVGFGFMAYLSEN